MNFGASSNSCLQKNKNEDAICTAKKSIEACMPIRHVRKRSRLAENILFIYFLSTFSYAHLPLAVVHHSLGSIFNYIFFLISIVSIAVALNKKNYGQAGQKFLFFSSSVLVFIAGTQAIFVLPHIREDGDILIKSWGSISTTLLSYFGVFLAICLANHVKFTFRQLSAASFYSLAVLISYLFIEILGVQFNVEPFSSIVQIVSRYFNYRDEVDSLGGRVRGFSNEPSYMAIVVIFLTAILLIDKTRKIKINYLFVVLVIMLSAASLSKNLLGGLMVLLFVHALYNKKLFPFIFMLIASNTAYFMYAVSRVDGMQWQYEAYGYDISTITRVGSWVAAFDGFVSAPILGNGYGLAGGLLYKFYPEWFYMSPEAVEWESAASAFATPVFSNFFRVAFESGLVGLFLTFGSIYLLIRASNKRSLISHDNAVLVCAFLLCFGMVDIMSYWPFYVALGIRRSSVEIR